MEFNAGETYKFLEKRKLERINLKTDLSADIHKVFVPLNKGTLKSLITQMNLEKKPDLCVISKAKMSKFQDEMYFYCKPSTTYRFYSVEDGKLKIVKSLGNQEDQMENQKIKMNTKTQSFLSKIPKDGRKDFGPLTKNKTNKKTHIHAYMGEPASDEEIQNHESAQTSY